MILGTLIEDIDLETTMGKMRLYEYQGSSFLLFMSHPNDYTPVCTTELTHAANIIEEFTKRNVKLIGMSCDSLEEHHGWLPDLIALVKAKELPYPIIADPKREIATKFDMLDPQEKDKNGEALTARACMVIAPNHRMKLQIFYPATVGRNFSEILRCIDSLKLAATGKYATPANWRPGDKCMPPPCMQDSDYSKPVIKINLPSGKNYMRFVDVED